MSKRFTYSRGIQTMHGFETFKADEFDSFDEAINAVEKGIRDRRDQLKKEMPGTGLGSGMFNHPQTTGAPLIPAGQIKTAGPATPGSTTAA